jgi:isopentenyldiphosphate isomerase
MTEKREGTYLFSEKENPEAFSAFNALVKQNQLLVSRLAEAEDWIKNIAKNGCCGMPDEAMEFLEQFWKNK